MTPPPEAVLIRRVRQATGITVDAASERAGISKARWTQVETGREKRKDGYHRAVAPPGTLARMAHALRLTPDRLAAEGARPDAAEVLGEILRDDAPAAPPDLPLDLRFEDPEECAIAEAAWAANIDPGDKRLVYPEESIRRFIGNAVGNLREQRAARLPGPRQAAG